MPSETIPGTKRHAAVSVKIMTTPTASHITPTSNRKPGLDGRRPTWTGLSGPADAALAGGFGAPPLGVTRPVDPAFGRRLAMAAKGTGTGAPRHGQ
jgi:hypothetical protein